MMKEHVNFYENLREAHMRLRGTVVMYDKIPYYVMAITAHKPDGVFRIYLDPIGKSVKGRPYPHDLPQFPADAPQLGVYLDTWLAANKDAVILRKKMNSSLFNKYRPFPLGMCNYGKNTFYIERQPNRKTEQGLVKSMLFESLITTGSRGDSPKAAFKSIDVHTDAFRDCILAAHPTAEECLKNLTDSEIEDDSAAFHRHFALVRGPIDMLFLAYKEDIVGVLPRGDFSSVRLGRDFTHCTEAVQELDLFKAIMY